MRVEGNHRAVLGKRPPFRAAVLGFVRTLVPESIIGCDVVMWKMIWTQIWILVWGLPLEYKVDSDWPLHFPILGVVLFVQNLMWFLCHGHWVVVFQRVFEKFPRFPLQSSFYVLELSGKAWSRLGVTLHWRNWEFEANNFFNAFLVLVSPFETCLPSFAVIRFTH